MRPDLQPTESIHLLCLQGNCADLDLKSAQHCDPTEVNQSIHKAQQQYKDIAKGLLNHNFTLIKNMKQ